MGRFAKPGLVTGQKKSGPKTHQECRESLCARCFGRRNLRNISKQMECVMQESTPDFSLLNEALPVKICDKCRLYFSYIKKVQSGHEAFYLICYDLICRTLTIRKTARCHLTLSTNR